jgi:hypothetical protein
LWATKQSTGLHREHFTAKSDIIRKDIGASFLGLENVLMKHIRLPDIFHRYRPLPILSVMVLSVLLLAFSSPQPGKTTVQTTSQPGDASSVDIPSSLEQCLNGTLDNPVFCTGDELTPDLGWSSSDGTELNSHWSEGQSVPFRFHVSGLAAGAHHLILQYSFTTLTGEHVYDYLTSFNRSLPDASACLPGDLTVDCLVSSTLPIPKDMDLPACVTTQHDPKGSSIVQVPGVLTMYNGYLTSAEYLDSHKCFGSGIEASLAVTWRSSPFLPTMGSPTRPPSHECSYWGIEEALGLVPRP